MNGGGQFVLTLALTCVLSSEERAGVRTVVKHYQRSASCPNSLRLRQTCPHEIFPSLFGRPRATDLEPGAARLLTSIMSITSSAFSAAAMAARWTRAR